MTDLKRSLSNLFKKHWPTLLILLLVVTFFWKVFLKGHVPIPADFVVGTYFPWLDYKWGFEVGVPVKNPITTDVVSFTYPMQTLAIKLLKLGEAPLWNPYILTGTPLFANFQSAPFAINNIFYFLSDTLTGWSLKVVSQHFLVALFTFFLLRHWKLNKLPSVMGGILFAFAGFNTIWSQWNAHALAASFIPLVLLFIDKYLDEKRLRYAIFLSFTLFLQIISGYPQIVFYTFIAALLLWIIRFEKNKGYFVSTLTLLVFSFLGLFLSSFQILPAWELLQHSQREVELLEFSWAFLPWSKIVTFLAPDFFGNHATQNYWGPTDYTTTTGFVGVAGIVLAGLGSFLLKRKREVLFALFLSLFALVLALPSPISIWVRESGIFGLQAASAHRALVLFNLGIAILSAFGVQRLFDKKKKIEIVKPLLIPGVILFAFGIYSSVGYFYSDYVSFPGITFADDENLWVSLRNLVLPTLAFVASFILLLASKKKLFRKFVPMFFLILMVFELFRFGWKFTPFSPRRIVYPTTPTLDYVLDKEGPFRVTTTEVIPINIKMTYGIEALEGYDAVYPVDIAKYIAVLNSENEKATPQGRYATVSRFDSRLLDLANTKYFFALKKDEEGDPDDGGVLDERFDKEKFEVVFEDKTTVVLENKEVLPRAFVVQDWEVVNERQKIFERLLDEEFPLAEKIILEKDPGINPAVKGEAEVEYLDYQDQQSTLLVKSDTPSLLFVSDLYYPGWKVFVDGKKKEILRANYTFRAVTLPEGEHKVQFIYEPESFKIGGWLSIATLIFSLGVFFYDQKSKDSRRDS